MEALKIVLEKESQQLAEQLASISEKRLIIRSKLEILDEIIDIIEGLQEENNKQENETKIVYEKPKFKCNCEYCN